MTTPITGWRRFASMEPLAFALQFAFSISDNVMTDLIIYRTCKTIDGINHTECDILHENSSSKEAIHIENLVQPHTGLIIVLKSCIEVIFPTILSLFLGPWSDKYGRKPLLVFPLIGYILYYASIAFISSLNANPYWILLPSVPSALFGGFPVIFLTFFCYITDITDDKNRAWHVACLDTAWFAGILAGIFVGPALFKAYGYVAVFSLSGILCLFALLFAFFFVQETVQNENERTLRSVFDCSLVKELFDAVTKKREGFDRYLVWLCMAAIALHVVVFEGNSSITILFTSAKLGWNISDFSYYTATQLLISISGMLVLIKLAGSVLKIPDTMVVVLSCISTSASCIIKALVSKPWHMYLSSGIGMFSGCAVPMLKSIISKTVFQKDLGKTFSLTTTIEMIVPFTCTPLYMYIYTHTLHMYPSPVWFLSAALPFIMIILTLLVERRWRRLRNDRYTLFTEITD